MLREKEITLLERIRAKEARVGVVGLGYVGLPLAMAFAEAGFPVTGLDIDERKIDLLTRGKSYFRHIPEGPIAQAVLDGRLHPTRDYSRVEELDAVLVCVPTPLTAAREPDMSYIISTAEALVEHVRPEQIYVLESTTWPGTTEEVFRPILERSGLKAGEDFYLAFSPEREDPGSEHTARNTPKVVGGYSPRCLEVAVALYRAAVPKVVQVSSTRAAEMTKLLENTFRSVNIAMVNEMKMLCDRMGLDVWEIIEAASSKGFGFMPFYPGPGLGGHCIPIDPFYLTWKAREFEFSTRFIELAGEINTNMPRYVVERTIEALEKNQKSLNGARLLVLGVAYKKDIDDLRESPALRVMDLLTERGAHVAYHDPYIPSLPKMRHHDLRLVSQPLTADLLGAADAVLILTDHSEVDYERVVRQARLVVDTRNATKGIPGAAEKVTKA
ncbi:MAG TPA: nucleotide sugar dehydrogenase [Myxococcales bacterium]|jgi:UDP-N-acetyl-D-glucosamine dehydrogenase